LITDLKFWTHDDRFVQQRWAAAFWRGKASSDTQENNETNSTTTSKGE
jgi:hypothetical protein